jgi:ATP-dependent DNA helicase HFM1/MER3
MHLLPDSCLQLLNRRPPFGHEIISCAREFPEYSLRVRELGVRCNGGRDAVEVDLSIECGLAAEYSKIFKLKKQVGRKANMTAVLTITSDFEFIDFRRIPYVSRSIIIPALINHRQD